MKKSLIGNTVYQLNSSSAIIMNEKTLLLTPTNHLSKIKKAIELV